LLKDAHNPGIEGKLDQDRPHQAARLINSAYKVPDIFMKKKRGKSAIEDYFDYSYELNETLKKRHKIKDLALVNSVMLDPGKVIYTRQQEPLGLGHAIWCARHLIHNEPFAVILGDEIMVAPDSTLKNMMGLHEKTGANIVSIMQVPPEETIHYGIVDPKDTKATSPLAIKDFVEKPAAGKAPSSWALTGRYILTPEIFPILEHIKRGVGEEIQLTDAMRKLVKTQEFLGYEIQGQRFDCGSKVGLLKAILSLALSDPEMRDEIASDLRNWR
jgi:UTP--glucose-1-phosphate uridylyltransferase